MPTGFDRRALLAALAALLALPGTAAAVEAVRLPGSTVLSGPVMAGDRVLWTRTSGSVAEIVEVRPGAAVTIATVYAPPGAYASAGVAASDEAVVVAEHQYVDLGGGRYAATREVRRRILAAPTGAPLREVADLCPFYGSPVALAASGTRVASVSRCAWTTPPVLRIVDLATDERHELELPHGWRSFRLAGDLVGWAEGPDDPDAAATRVTVVDLRTGERRVAWDGGDVDSWQLRADGAIAVRGATGELRWVEASGTARTLATGVDSVFGPIDDRLLIGRGDRLSLLPTAGGEARDVAVVPELLRLSFDGRSAALSQRACGGTLQWRLDDLDTGTPAVLPKPAPCPKRGLLTRRAEVDRQGRFTVFLRCPYGCRGRLRVGVHPDEPYALTRFELPESDEPQAIEMRFADRVPLRLRRGKVKRMDTKLVGTTRSSSFETYRSTLTLIPKR